jgi:hypothetical protein
MLERIRYSLIPYLNSLYSKPAIGRLARVPAPGGPTAKLLSCEIQNGAAPAAIIAVVLYRVRYGRDLVECSTPHQIKWIGEPLTNSHMPHAGSRVAAWQHLAPNYTTVLMAYQRHRVLSPGFHVSPNTATSRLTQIAGMNGSGHFTAWSHGDRADTNQQRNIAVSAPVPVCSPGICTCLAVAVRKHGETHAA